MGLSKTAAEGGSAVRRPEAKGRAGHEARAPSPRRSRRHDPPLRSLVEGLPGREVVWHHAPGRTRPHNQRRRRTLRAGRVGAGPSPEEEKRDKGLTKAHSSSPTTSVGYGFGFGMLACYRPQHSGS